MADDLSSLPVVCLLSVSSDELRERDPSQTFFSDYLLNSVQQITPAGPEPNNISKNDSAGQSVHRMQLILSARHTVQRSATRIDIAC